MALELKNNTVGKDVILEMVQVYARQRIPKGIHRFEVRMMEDYMSNAVDVFLSGLLPSERVNTVDKTVSFSYPANWWQMFKKQYAPQWFIDSHPIKEKTEKQTVSVSLMAGYPQLATQFPHDQQYNVIHYFTQDNTF